MAIARLARRLLFPLLDGDDLSSMGPRPPSTAWQNGLATRTVRWRGPTPRVELAGTERAGGKAARWLSEHVPGPKAWPWPSGEAVLLTHTRALTW